MNFLDPRLPDRFWSKCIPEPMTGCWLWIGATASNGYGSYFTLQQGRKRNMLPHRVTYMIEHGSISVDLVIDHKCRVSQCCNPDHLEQITNRENVLRGLKGRLKTHCKHGHEYTPANVRTKLHSGSRLPSRYCGVCSDIGSRGRKLVDSDGNRPRIADLIRDQHGNVGLR